jgi:hypothetical protein
MPNVARKWLLGTSLLLCLGPSLFALDPDFDRDHRKCKPNDNCQQQAPEGGTGAMYILAAGLTCLGAMYLRSRSSKPSLRG